ncbi:right-handed parallel beta-helix repeat-containing protein [Sinorhizobium medicae]
MINLGSAEIGDLRVGASQVARVYLGEDIIWQPNFDSLPAAIYFSATGNDDTGAGTQAAPFKTLKMANAVARAGKTLYFRGGDTFTGTLLARPGCVYNSYGTGKATISSGNSEAILLDNADSAQVRRLIAQGSGTTVNGTHGIRAINSHSEGIQVDDVVIDSCEVRGYGRNGIFATVADYPSGLTGLQITNNIVEDCTQNDERGHTGGIIVAAEEADFWGLATYPASHRDVVVTGNTVRRCKGKRDAPNHVGSGIIVAQTEGGLVENNLAEDCGENSTNQAGPVGIWAWDAIGVVIRKNTVLRQRSARADGGGFDLDGGCKDCVLEYNFSMGCTGPGIIIFSFDDTAYPANKLLDYSNNVARYNLSVRDGQTVRSEFGMFIGTMRPVASDFQNIRVYNNTIVVDTVGAFSPTCLSIQTFGGVDFSHATGVIANNIFLQKGAGLLCDVRTTAMQIHGNCFHSVQGTAMRAFGFDWETVDQWISASGNKEFLHGTHTIFVDNPQLVNDSGIDPEDLRPADDSPLYGVGMDINAEFGIARPTEDFLGNALPATQVFFTPGAMEPATPLPNLLTSPNVLSTGWELNDIDLISGLPGMFGGTSAQNIRVDAEGAAVGQLRTFTAGTEKFFRRGGFVKPAADVIAAVIGNRRPDEADYWWTWFDIVAGELDDADAWGAYLDSVPRFRMQKRPNGFWLIMHEMKIPSTWTQDKFWAQPSAPHPVRGGINDGLGRGLIHDGFFEFRVG